MLGSMTLASDGELNLTDAVLQQISNAHGAVAEARVRAWRDLLLQRSETHEKKMLALANDFFNRLRPMRDIELWRKEDYWATPIEALIANGGDCEDYSLAKYLTLRHMGIAEEKLHITYVKALELNEAHMVLAYYPSATATPLILDNLNPQILPADQRTDLKPVYSFNGAGLWTSINRARGKRVGNAQQIGLWRDFLERMKKELGAI
jgi:predicted transglutaminase-like cysteine proteinase